MERPHHRSSNRVEKQVNFRVSTARRDPKTQQAQCGATNRTKSNTERKEIKKLKGRGDLKCRQGQRRNFAAQKKQTHVIISFAAHQNTAQL